MLIKKVVTQILVFGKLFRATVVSMAIKSYNQLKFLNLVTMATTQIVSKPCFMLIKKIVIQILVFGQLFKTKSYNKLQHFY